MPDQSKSDKENKTREINTHGGIFGHNNILIFWFRLRFFLLGIPPWFTRFYFRNEGKIVKWRGGRRRPFKRPTIPGITCRITKLLSFPDTDTNLKNLHGNTEANNQTPNKGNDKKRLPAC